MDTKGKLIFLFMSMVTLFACQAINDGTQSYLRIRDAYNAEMDAFMKKMTSTPAAEQRTLMKEMPDRSGYIDTLRHFINTYPDAHYLDDVYVEIYMIKALGFRDSMNTKAIKALTDHYPDSDALKKINPLLISKSRNPYVNKWVEEVLDKNTNPKVLGIFSIAAADRLTQPFNPADKNLEEGIALYDKVINKYGDIKVEGSAPGVEVTLGELALNAKRKFTELTVGAKAPEIISKDLAGSKVKLSDYNGQLVVLDIWATWCAPCIQMIPHQRELVKQYSDNAFELISISIDEQVEIVNNFQSENPMPWPQWFNGPEGGILSQWNITAYPTIIIIDKNGIIRHRNDGAITKGALNNLIAEIINS